MKTTNALSPNEITPKMVIMAFWSFFAKIYLALWIFAMLRPGEKWSTFNANHLWFVAIGFISVFFFLFSRKNGWFKK